jgi:ACS family allantoate permease-like MFS transporter
VNLNLTVEVAFSNHYLPLRTMGASSEVSGESKKHEFAAVSTREVDTAAELGSGEGPVDPAEAIRVRLVLLMHAL